MSNATTGLLLVACWLAAAPAGAKPYPPFVDAPRLALPISPYTEDPEHWTGERVAEALAMADRHLDVCAIDLVAGPLQLTQHRAVRWGESLRRTEDPLELVLILRDAGDLSHNNIAGVASFRGWRVEGPWSDVAPALAQLASGGTARYWPKPDSDGATTQAWMALMWAVGKGWATPAPSITEAHCAVMRKRITAMGRRHGSHFAARKRKAESAAEQAGANARFRARSTWRFSRRLGLLGKPSALLIADEPGRAGYRWVVRVGERWILDWVERSRAPASVPAVGRGVGLLVFSRATMVLLEAAAGQVHARWVTRATDSTVQTAVKPLPGCAAVLVADVLRRTGSGETGSTEAFVVCAGVVHRLRADGELRAEALPDKSAAGATWATLTRWGPRRARLLMGGGGALAGFVLRVGEATAPWAPPAEALALAKQRPEAPVWAAAGNAVVQVGKRAIHGLGKPRPLGDAQVDFNGNVYQALRSRVVDGRTQLRVDDVYNGRGWTTTLPVGALWAAHSGDYDPLVLALVPEGRIWVLRPPAWQAVGATSPSNKGAPRSP